MKGNTVASHLPCQFLMVSAFKNFGVPKLMLREVASASQQYPIMIPPPQYSLVPKLLGCTIGTEHADNNPGS